MHANLTRIKFYIVLFWCDLFKRKLCFCCYEMFTARFNCYKTHVTSFVCVDKRKVLHKKNTPLNGKVKRLTPHFLHDEFFYYFCKFNHLKTTGRASIKDAKRCPVWTVIGNTVSLCLFACFSANSFYKNENPKPQKKSNRKLHCSLWPKTMEWEKIRSKNLVVDGKRNGSFVVDIYKANCDDVLSIFISPNTKRLNSNHFFLFVCLFFDLCDTCELEREE